MEEAPLSVLIVGSGVFGLSTAWSLTKQPFFDDTTITIVDCADHGRFPPPDAASVDHSRLIRPDYADGDYAALAMAAQEEWRKQGDDDLGGQQRYAQSGLVLAADDSRAGGYVTRALDQVRKRCQNMTQNRDTSDNVRTFESKEALDEYLGTDHAGDWGYLNTGSGWADAGKAMSWLYKRVEATQRVDFVGAKVKRLETRDDRVVGARLSDDKVLEAEVVLVAAGAWTGELIDLRGRVEATGQPIGFVELTEQEAAIMAEQPSVLNLSTGLFVIPPRGRVLKVARHGFGYLNPRIVNSALPATTTAQMGPIMVSRPSTRRDVGDVYKLPAEADADLRRGLRDLTPIGGLETRPWKETRLCWYSDTKDGNWLIDWHPEWKGLFVATGDSGHGFKFLPLLGDKVVDVMLGRGGDLGRKWMWRDSGEDGEGREIDGRFRGLRTLDQSRAGVAGMVLEEELKKAEGTDGPPVEREVITGVL
ncbi:fructosyl-amino acid oxidase [Ophiocordyceps camponoti-floridani]|uniref:Fructosyl-amino acid oxidase n=1 Tax=Ophiocordyceps camponoti-floridani TaxID=2030778 RepID=A0A8H4QDM1_9HYPO|nr:fructosyl-amino acid oxidase [Ophiocordyceps camponoti-floridani]